MAIKAIETVYKGCRFRSRLEARWAVFFDTLGIRWQYEPQGFEIVMHDRARRYLPDFYLPDEDVWVEVKGDDGRIDWTLLGIACDGFADAGLPQSRRAYGGGSDQGSAVLVLGDIPPDDLTAWAHPLVVNQKGVYCEWHMFICTAASSHRGPLRGELVDARMATPGYFDASWAGFDGSWDWETTPSVHGRPVSLWDYRAVPRDGGARDAYTAARMARFEHGESGR